MKSLDINITKASISSFTVSAREGKPEVDVIIALMTEGGKVITSYSCSTNHWQDKNKIELPISALPLIGDLARMLEGLAVRQCRDSQLALAPPKTQDKKTDLADIDDKPIDLTDIPF